MNNLKYLITIIAATITSYIPAYSTCYVDGTTGQGTVTQCGCTQAGYVNNQLVCGGTCSKTTSPGIPACKPAGSGQTGCTTVRGTITIQASTANCVANAQNNNCVAGTWTSPVPIAQNYQGGASSGGPCPVPTPDPNE